MQNDRESRQAVGNFLKDIKAQLRLLAGFELVSTVARADCNGKGVHACPCYKILYLVRIRELCFVVFYLDVVLNAGKFAELGLYRDVVLVCILDHSAGLFHILLIGLCGTVKHDGGEAVVDASLAHLKGRAMVQMQGNRNIRILFYSGLDHLYQIGRVRILAGAGRNLQDHRGLQLRAGAHNALDDFHIVNIERADRIAAVVCLLNISLVFTNAIGITPIF